jgi:hypothetical protein
MKRWKISKQPLRTKRDRAIAWLTDVAYKHPSTRTQITVRVLLARIGAATS